MKQKIFFFVLAALIAGAAQNVKADDKSPADTFVPNHKESSTYKPNYKELKLAPKPKTKVATSCTCRKKVTKTITTRYVIHKSLLKPSDK